MKQKSSWNRYNKIPDIIKDEDLRKWLNSQPERKIYTYRKGYEEEIPFCNLRKGNPFIAKDNGKKVTDKKGNSLFKAASNPHLWLNEIMMIDVE